LFADAKICSEELLLAIATKAIFIILQGKGEAEGKLEPEERFLSLKKLNLRSEGGIKQAVLSGVVAVKAIKFRNLKGNFIRFVEGLVSEYLFEVLLRSSEVTLEAGGVFQQEFENKLLFEAFLAHFVGLRIDDWEEHFEADVAKQARVAILAVTRAEIENPNLFHLVVW